MGCHENEFRGIYLPLTYPFLPMKSKNIDGLCSGKSLSPGSETKEKEIVFEQTFRTLGEEHIDAFNKELIKKARSYACETQCFPVEPSGCRRVLVCSVFFVCFRFSSGLDEKGKKVYVPLRTADSQAGRCGMQPKPSSLRAQAQLSEKRTETVETFELVKVESKLLREEKGERERCASRRYLLHIIVKLIC
ncbi:hypothetical protein TNCV_4491431 [Trichonephila clavipes]|nr:hypothetical protein TNCV_4491431 [Trichonephila clavipes]